jgi:multiple sugar transport system ATP-binding protein
MARLELRGIHKHYGGRTVLPGIDFVVEDGEFLVLVGPSGCGKSTLLRIVAGLIAADGGELLLDGRRVNDLEPRERDVAMVFQNYALYPHMSVEQNLAFPLRLRREPRAAVRAKVAEVAQLLGLGDLLLRKPATLSGGQMQRVALGRAIIRSPRLFLFDEPLSNLDAKLRGEMRAEIARLHERLAITTIYVTHDQAEAMTLGSRIAVMQEGRIEQLGPPLEVFDAPASPFVASFIGSPAMNLIAGRLADGRFRAGPLELGAPLAGSREVLLGIRPHQVRLGGPCELEVRALEKLGSQTLVDLDVAGQSLNLSHEGTLMLEPGERLSVELPPQALHWFDPLTGARLA